MKYTIKDITEIGIFAGIAIILNFSIFKIKITPEAGSISFVMIPLFIIAIRHSWWKSFIAGGIIYGLAACAIGGHGFQYYPLSYLISYGSIAIISLFRKLILKDNNLSYLYLIISVIIVTFIRFSSETITSMYIGTNYSFQAAVMYNAPYIFITGGIGLVAMILLLKPLKIINNKYSN